jgi:hypothetical protein
MDNELPIFYVYQLRDPRENLPFYIGKGKGKRAWDHLKPSNTSIHSYKNNVIKQIQTDGKEPSVEILHSNLSEKESLELECLYIEKFGRRNIGTGCLTNLTDGGDGTSGAIITEEHRQKVSIAVSAKWTDKSFKEEMSLKFKDAAARMGSWNRIQSTDRTKLVWSKADLIEQLKEFSNNKLIKILQLPPESNKQVRNIKNKLRDGWSPLLCPLWTSEFVPNDIKNYLVPEKLNFNKIEAYLIGISKDPPWKSFRSTKETILAWSLADRLLENTNVNPRKLARNLNLSEACGYTLKNILHKWIDKGWNPLEDPQWIRDFRGNPDSTNS